MLMQMRLTFNYWRKGGYTIGLEDYRWETVQKLIGPISWALLSLFFIAFYQSVCNHLHFPPLKYSLNPPLPNFYVFPQQSITTP